MGNPITGSGRGSGRSRPHTTETKKNIFKPSMHSPPRFVMDGAQLFFGKGAGLASSQGPILSLSGKVFVPKSWTGVPKNKTKYDLHYRRKMNDKIQQKELQNTLDAKLNIVKRPSLAQTYGRVLTGSNPIPCFTRTQSELFQKRGDDQLSSIQEKSKNQEVMRAQHPSKTRNKLAIKEQVRDWEINKQKKSRYEQLIAPMGRDRELARKTFWTKDHHTYIGPGYRHEPHYPTRQAILNERKKEINMLATRKIDESWNRTHETALKNEKLARQATLNDHVPFHTTQSELFKERKEQPTKDAILLRNKAERIHKNARERCMTAPSIPRGWWQKSDTLINPSDVLKKGSAVRLRTIAQRQVQPATDPFKTYSVSMHTLNRTRSNRQQQSVELAVVDRSGPEWTQGSSHLPKQPSIPVKRWSDVVIEFQQADQKLDERRMMEGGGEGGEGGGGGGGGVVGSVVSLADARPLYSSFTKDQIFREPQYKESAKDKLNMLDQASFVLQPLGRYNLEGSGSTRSLTLMQRNQRATRFRAAYGEKVRQRQNGTDGVGMNGSLTASSSFGGVPMTPGNDRERFRDNGSSRGNPSRQGTIGGGTMKMDPPTGRRVPSPISGNDSMSGINGGMMGASTMSTTQLDMNSGSIQNMNSSRHTQSVPELSELQNKSRASTAPSSAMRNKSRRGTPTRSVSRGASRGSSRGLPPRGQSAGGIRPTTAPLRMTKRPGTAVRTRGFFE